MKKNILIYGLIAGAIVSTLMVLSMSLIGHNSDNGDYSTSLVIGYASMILAFSLVFMGTRNYRNNYNGGTISFGKAFKIGILIVLIASTMYVVTWLIYYYNFSPDFMEKFSAQQLGQLKASGASQATIDAQTKEWAKNIEMYKNPFFVILMTYAEILPVGLLVTLISSFILKRKVAKN